MRRALAAIRTGIDAADEYDLPVASADDGRLRRRGRPVRGRRRRGPRRSGPASRPATRCVAEALPLDGAVLTRRQVLTRLGDEPSSARRRSLFLALEPLWRAVDGDGGTGSPYRPAHRRRGPDVDRRHGPGERQRRGPRRDPRRPRGLVPGLARRVARRGRGRRRRRPASRRSSRGTGGGRPEPPSARSDGVPIEDALDVDASLLRDAGRGHRRPRRAVRPPPAARPARRCPSRSARSGPGRTVDGGRLDERAARPSSRR